MKLLNDVMDREEEKSVESTRSPTETNNQSSLRKCTIQAMSNLLSANIDSGLRHSIGKPYHLSLDFNIHVWLRCLSIVLWSFSSSVFCPDLFSLPIHRFSYQSYFRLQCVLFCS